MTARRVALVTGGAKRVGRAIVETLAGEKFDIAFTYNRSGADAESVRAAVAARGVRAVAIDADFFDPASAVDRIAQVIEKEFGRLDVLVNNASTFFSGSLEEVNLEQMRRLWAVHAETPTLLCQRFAPFLRGSRGHIVNMIDLLAERPTSQYLAYSASKAALWNLTLGLARELAPEVTVNGIAPGVVEWPADYPQPERERYLRRVPLGRPGTPAEVADLVVFLCTRGGYFTGQIFRLDGGRSIT